MSADSCAKLHRNFSLRIFPALNGTRAIAALAVVFYHWAPLLKSPGTLSALSPGPYAVIFFFVLSGFLITTLMLREQEKSGEVNLYSFWIRRALRILPAFYAYLVIQAILIRQFPDDFLATALYLSNYYQAFKGWTATVVGHTWSLSVEEQFYLIWPMVFIFVRDKNRLQKILFAGIILVEVWRAVGNHFGVPYYYRYFAFEFRCDALMLGCLMAFLLKNKPAVPGWLLNKAVGVFSMLLFPLLMMPWQNHFLQARVIDPFSYTIIAYASAIVIVQAIAYAPAVLNNKWMDYLGATSYSIYVYHQLVLDLSKQLLGRVSTPIVVLIYVAGTVGAASLSYLLIEKPFLRLKAVLEKRQIEKTGRLQPTEERASVRESSFQS